MSDQQSSTEESSREAIQKQRPVLLKISSHPLAIGIIGALLGILGSWIIAILQSRFNSTLEIDKQRNAALIDMMSVHIQPNTPQPLLDIQDSMRQVLFYTLASKEAIRSAAEIERQHRYCLNDMSYACRENFIQNVELLRKELGRENVAHKDIVDALNEPFDKMENALDEALDENLVQFSNTRRSNIKFSTQAMGTSMFKNVGDEFNDLVTDGFAERFPGYRYSIAVIDSVFIFSNAPAECVVMVGVSSRSLGVKTVRVPGQRFFNLNKMSTPSPSDDDKRACLRAAMRSAVKEMMAVSPGKLAEESQNSL